MNSLETLADLASRYRTAQEALDRARDDIKAHLAETSPTSPAAGVDPISDYAAAKGTGFTVNTIRKWRGKTSSTTSS